MPSISCPPTQGKQSVSGLLLLGLILQKDIDSTVVSEFNSHGVHSDLITKILSKYNAQNPTSRELVTTSNDEDEDGKDHLGHERAERDAVEQR